MYNSNNLGNVAYEGLVKGNYFLNTYVPYKNYMPMDINPKNEKEYLMLMIQVYGLASHDLLLYLDLNPNNKEYVDLRKEYEKLYQQYYKQYEEKYGALDVDSKKLFDAPWKWDFGNWPWEEKNNVEI